MQYSDIGGRNVYLLKDVVSTGVIETYLLMQLRQKNPRGLKLVALVDRPELRTVGLDVDFRAFEADHRGSFVGYGLEWDGKHGNLPYIGRV
jgi:hypoxanthine phosphoribosyltransferase